ncbi:unnamed protein product (macronuclear) [Paramecium tetraurelia]|uniref:Tetratricopeptide repeat protein n=1 Tax=Paramecium tetraurelia TaxID=5888 RepID=A0DMQ0_PARTE|nr:uncharacterized protein GSPATT00018521001 [Paramecium tetraurelia]CAK84317.1 unnamed protein product [Paramecium tetraurelia]|eukprot:XP_001451714.1 hypothetical protein (macronuclear) [Paramecium tetraurelia strain d4-2]
MEIEGSKFQEITLLVKSKLVQLEFDASERKLQEIESSRVEHDQRIRKLTEDLDYEDRSEWVDYHRTQGTKYYQKQQYDKALYEYYLSILALNDSKMWREFGVPLIHNIQLNLELLKKPATMELLQFVLYIDTSNIKAYFKLGKCHRSNGQIQAALQYFQQGEKLCHQIQDKESASDFQKQIQECRRLTNQSRN